MPQVPVAAPGEYPHILLVVVPEYIGGDGIDPCGFHLLKLAAPIAAVTPGIVEFPAHRVIRRAVQFHVLIGERDGIAPGIGPTHLQMAGVYSPRAFPHLHRVWFHTALPPLSVEIHDPGKRPLLVPRERAPDAYESVPQRDATVPIQPL